MMAAVAAGLLGATLFAGPAFAQTVDCVASAEAAAEEACAEEETTTPETTTPETTTPETTTPETTTPETTTPTPTDTDRPEPPATGGDVDCGDVSKDEAQAILDADKSDPNRLDADKDGEACDSTDVTTEDVDNHEQFAVVPDVSRGVDTGDGSLR